MDIKTYTTHHLVKSEDLNHHGTLYAGRNAEWFVESGFIATAGLIAPERIVCRNIHGIPFTRPVNLGEIVCFTSKVVLTGTSSLIAHVSMSASDEEISSGFITFVNVDHQGSSQPHGIEMTPTTSQDIALQEQARKLW